jgi:hypothetical protein
MVICVLVHSIHPIEIWSSDAAAVAGGAAAVAAGEVVVGGAAAIAAAEAVAGGAAAVAGSAALVVAGSAIVLGEAAGGALPTGLLDSLGPSACVALYYSAAAGGLYTWWHFLKVEFAELRFDSEFDLRKHYASFWCARGPAAAAAASGLLVQSRGPRSSSVCAERWRVRGPPRSLTSLRARDHAAPRIPTLRAPLRNVVDAFNLLAVPALILPTTALSALHHPDAAAVGSQLVPLAAVLQLTLALRMLQYVSLYRPLGPLLVTVGGMLKNIVQFFGVYAFVLLGFADAIYVLFNASPGVLDRSIPPVSYQAILTQMVRGWWRARRDRCASVDRAAARHWIARRWQTLARRPPCRAASAATSPRCALRCPYRHPLPPPRPPRRVGALGARRDRLCDARAFAGRHARPRVWPLLVQHVSDGLRAAQPAHRGAQHDVRAGDRARV